MSFSTEIVLPKNFDLAKLSYGDPKQQGTGGKSIFISYEGSGLLVQTPEMKAPFGVTKWEGENGGPDKYDLKLSFDNVDAKDSVRAFFNMLETLDTSIVTYAMDNSQKWFKKRFPSLDVVKELYSECLKYSKDKETGEKSTRYAPTFKMSLPTKDGRFTFPVYNGKRQEVDLMDLITAGRTKGARAQAIVALTSVWIVGTKFGLSWKVKQLKLSEPPSLNRYAFQRTEDDEDEEEDVEEEANNQGGSAKREDDEELNNQLGRLTVSKGGSKGGAKDAKGGDGLLSDSDGDDAAASSE